MSRETGGIGTGLAVFVVLVLLAFGACLAVADDDENSLGVPAELIAGGGNDNCGGDRSCHPGSDDCAHAEGDCSDDDMSPSFEDSPVIFCLPESTCQF